NDVLRPKKLGRTLLATVLASTLLIGMLPVKINAAADYFPIAVNNSWIYEWCNTVYRPTPVIENLTVISNTPEVIISGFILQCDSAAYSQFHLRSSADGLYWTGFGSGGADPFPLPMYVLLYYAYIPTKFLPTPLNLGDSWTGSGSVPGRGQDQITYTATSTALRFESITVPAGTFNCILVETTITATNSLPGADYLSGTRQMWFADGVGLIKLVYNHRDGSVTEAKLLSHTCDPSPSGEYFPLATGNSWRYEWGNPRYTMQMKEVVTVMSSGSRYCLAAMVSAPLPPPPPQVNTASIILQEDQIYSSTDLSAPNQPLPFNIRWGSSVSNSPDAGAPAITNLKFEVDSEGIRSYNGWSATIPFPDSWLNPPDSIWDKNWWVWNSLAENPFPKPVATISFYPEIPIAVTETPGFSLSRAVDRRIFSEPGTQHFTGTVTVDQPGLFRLAVRIQTKDDIYPSSTPTWGGATIIPGSINPGWANRTGTYYVEWTYAPRGGVPMGTYNFSVDLQVNPEVGNVVDFVPTFQVTAWKWREVTQLNKDSTFIELKNVEVTPERPVGTLRYSSSDTIRWTSLTKQKRNIVTLKLISVVDNTPPTITLTSPMDYGLYPSTLGAKYTFSVKDNLDTNPMVTAIETDYDGNKRIITSGTPLPTIPGVYTLTVTAKDYHGNIATAIVTFVVYDPTAGFVTGGGWIIPEPTVGEHASFGFVAKYKKGSNLPEGNMEFQYKYRDINLKSVSIDWLAISNNRALFQGTATINGAGTYTFRVEAVDGDLTAGKPDYFAIKIWQGTNTETNPIHDYKGNLQGGNIIIHKK
ncbi:MAG: post-COAP-1 domain-containing protein, partial [Nitrososphaerota archaeon]